jgi:death-on-curing family protein
MQKELALFNSNDGIVSVAAEVDQNTIWLMQKQISELFDKTIPTINEHIKNIYLEEELDEISTIRKSRIVQTEGGRQVTREVDLYNLDVIISAGYRVKSKRGIEFRRWANQVLKDHLLKGYSINQNLVNIATSEFQQVVGLLKQTLISNQLINETGQSVINIIHSYAKTWRNLLQYDEDKLALPDSVHKLSKPLEYKLATNSINQLKQQLMAITEATKLFGNEREMHLAAILETLEQTMFGEELYKSVEEKAANLLYLIIKDHPFSDGNKRIASFLFLIYLDLNKLQLTIDDKGLTALTLLIAESDPKQKDLMVRLVVNLLLS